MNGYNGVGRRQIIIGWTALGFNTAHHLTNGLERKETLAKSTCLHECNGLERRQRCITSDVCTNGCNGLEICK